MQTDGRTYIHTHRHRDRKLASPVRKKKYNWTRNTEEQDKRKEKRTTGGAPPRGGGGESVSVTTGFALDKNCPLKIRSFSRLSVFSSSNAVVHELLSQ